MIEPKFDSYAIEYKKREIERLEELKGNFVDVRAAKIAVNIDYLQQLLVESIGLHAHLQSAMDRLERIYSWYVPPMQHFPMPSSNQEIIQSPTSSK